jgi:Na+/H+ antiporter NhaD/arsenite permease-like protein
MEFFLPVAIFILGYSAIAFEHNIKTDKAASALITGIGLWLLIFLKDPGLADQNLEKVGHHMAEIAGIAFFLLGAMTIVELIDTHKGFDLISGKLKINSFFQMTMVLSLTTFFLSALLDNLTTTIVMISIARKWVPEVRVRSWLVGLIVITANAGGAWSPLGDVTTTMLWVGGQISSKAIISETFFPSLAVAAMPALIIGWKFRNEKVSISRAGAGENTRNSTAAFIVGVSLLLFVPFLKSVSHMPPFLCMLFSLGLMWVFTSFLHFKKDPEERKSWEPSQALQRIDTPSILFFVGILLAVSALESLEILQHTASSLMAIFPDYAQIGTILGLISAIIDNVPLVAAAQGMFSMDIYPKDDPLWLFLALTTGTGGSAIIIGSAAGVAAMGLEKITFSWYLKKISLLALLGYFAGILVFLIM